MTLDTHDQAAVEAHAERLVESYDDLPFHAALVEIYFAPPESYDDAFASKLHEVYLYVEGQPCVCTEPAVDQYNACPRCRILNREFDEYVGHGR